MEQESTTASTKRQANDVLREAFHGRDDDSIAFFCECVDEACYQAVWLSGNEYDRGRARPGWLPLLEGHR